MRAPRALEQHLTAAVLLGLDLDARDLDGRALRDRIADQWGRLPGPARQALFRPRALERWREEVRAGTRRNDATSWDTLAAAAAAELAALEAREVGDLARAERMLRRAWVRAAGSWADPDSPEGKRVLGWLELALEELEPKERTEREDESGPRVIPFRRGRALGSPRPFGWRRGER